MPLHAGPFSLICPRWPNDVNALQRQGSQPPHWSPSKFLGLDILSFKNLIVKVWNTTQAKHGKKI